MKTFEEEEKSNRNMQAQIQAKTFHFEGVPVIHQLK